MELPTDHRRPAVQTFQGGVQGLGLTAALTGALNRWSEQQGVTLFMTLLAAFQVLLSRYTGAAEVVVGTAVANRNRISVVPAGFNCRKAPEKEHFLAGSDSSVLVPPRRESNHLPVAQHSFR